MPINKAKNKMLQCPLPKEVYEQLEAIVQAFREKGVPCTKGHNVTTALKGYVNLLVANGQALEELKQTKAEEPHKEKEDA